MNVYDVSPSGIELNSVYTEDWLFIGWGGVIDAAELSPDCSVLAISFKAHYIGLFQFDNELGEVTGSINDSFDNGGWTSDYAQVAFSPNSQYIYTVTEGYFQLSKYDISSFNGGIIGASQTSIAVDNSSPWTGIKLANDGAIYVYNSANNTLDRITNPDAPGDEVGFESNVVDIPFDLTIYFPETTNFQCGVLSPFFIPETFDVCLGEETQFELSYNFIPDSVQWDFGDPAGGLDNISTLEEPTYTYDEIGSYIVGLDVWFNGELTTFELVASVFDFPVLDLGPDQTICEGEIALLEAGVADNYEWSNGSDDAAISVTESGTYGVVVSNGVCAVEDEITVTVIPAIFVDLGNDLFPCPGDEVVLSAGQEATWNTGESATSIEVTESGEYTATLQNQCFTVQDDIQVQFVTLPEISLPELKTACTGDSVLLTLAIDTQSVQWVSSSETLIGDSVYVQYSDVFIANYIYQGCEASAQTEIEFLNGVDLSLITMPNIFTPNADQSNNTFRPMNIGNGDTNPCNFSLFNAEMQVFNRWGNLMSEGSCSWAGVNQNGQDCSEGVYYYIINMESNCPGAVNEKELTGSFTLAR